MPSANVLRRVRCVHRTCDHCHVGVWVGCYARVPKLNVAMCVSVRVRYAVHVFGKVVSRCACLLSTATAERCRRFRCRRRSRPCSSLFSASACVYLCVTSRKTLVASIHIRAHETRLQKYTCALKRTQLLQTKRVSFGGLRIRRRTIVRVL